MQASKQARKKKQKRKQTQQKLLNDIFGGWFL